MKNTNFATPESRGMEVAAAILQQLGGNRFKVMTGSYRFVAHSNALSMRLRSNKSGAQYLKITLDPSDTYTMLFTRLRGTELVTVRELSDLYSDQLQSFFTEVTGLYTSLGRMTS